LAPGLAADDCQAYRGEALHAVEHLYDGDTLKLADGRNIRLIGINAPEKGRDGKPDEPGAGVSLQGLSKLIHASDNQVYLLPGIETTDRYGRSLAHLYDRRGRNITAMLLRDGLGFAISIPPNLRHADCYKLAEQEARSASRGLWSDPSIPLAAEKLSDRANGFHLIRGRIERIGKSRRALWLNLVKGPAIRIDWSDWTAFADLYPDELIGKRLEVRGWIYRRKGQRRMQVRHPSAIFWID
jgi:endonuclease YncB( thermonuclease family)